AGGQVQSFHAVVRPLGETRPAWKVLRVLANIMGLQGMDFDSSQEVLIQAVGSATQLGAEQLSNATRAAISVAPDPATAPVVASIYQLDGLVRRAPALQQTADARRASEGAAA
ncbi:MAG: NADH-quinone oxidoreductase subunit G, partial [Proteobacteria bacterium]|nr:NADH-quinone oxidoreductase subunit G [Pseudomonadota bacterium]